MYFLAHMYTILSSNQINKLTSKEIEPLIYGCWCPDAEYFPFYARELTKFNHSPTPTINLFKNDIRKAKLFKIGWMCHIACDELIHDEAFFPNKSPLCPPIDRDHGLRVFFKTAKKHLGREVALDFLIYNQIDWELKTAEIIFSKRLYNGIKIQYPGFNKLQNYIYNYSNKFLPMATMNSSFGKIMKKLFDYEFYNIKFVKENIIDFIEKAKGICENIIKENITK